MPMIKQAEAKKKAAGKKPAAPLEPEAPEAAAAPQKPRAPGKPVQQTPQVQAGEEGATPEEQESYEEAIEMLYKIMYVDDKTSATVLDMLQPAAKVDSIVKTSVLLIQQVDQKLDLEAAVVPELVMMVPDMLIELAEAGKQMTFSEGELKAILGSAQEMVMQVIDVDAGEARRMMESITPEQKAQAQRDYQQFLSEASDESQGQAGAGAQQPVRPESGQQGAPVPGQENPGMGAEAPTAAGMASGPPEVMV